MLTGWSLFLVSSTGLEVDLSQLAVERRWKFAFRASRGTEKLLDFDTLWTFLNGEVGVALIRLKGYGLKTDWGTYRMAGTE